MSTAGGSPPAYGQPPGGGYPPPGQAQAPGGGYSQVPSSPPAGPFSSGQWAPHSYDTSRAYRSAKGLATAVVVMLIIMAVVSLLGVGAHGHRASVIDGWRDGSISLASEDDADDADVLVGLAAGLFVLGTLATGVVFIIWQHRHTKNAEALRGHAEGLGPGWAIGGWFIPLANFVLPGMQMFGASRVSDPRLPPYPGHKRGDGSGIVVWWAVIFGLAGVLDRVGDAMYPVEADAVGDLDGFLADAVTADQTMAAGTGLFMVAAIVAAVMVRQLTTRQDARAAALAAAADPRPTGPPGAWARPASPQPGAGAYPGPISRPVRPAPRPPGPGSGTWPGPAGGPSQPAPLPDPWAPPGHQR